jgi:hypothetical protein
LESFLLIVLSFSLRFYGNGGNDIDRVKILVENRSINIGGDFTIEFWMKAYISENNSSNCLSGSGDLWIYGNIILDRDVFGNGDYGDYGISLSGGKISFGVNRLGNGFTLCGNTNVADGNWHHIAITRREIDGRMRIYIDGQLDAEGFGPSGNIDYRNGRTTDYPNDRYLVIGAEKHDYDRDTYPSYSGWIDEIRISSIIRYESSFTPPNTPFPLDEQTIALYHLDEGPEGPCTGTIIDATGSNNGFCNYGFVDRPAGPVYSIDNPFSTITKDSEILNHLKLEKNYIYFNFNNKIMKVEIYDNSGKLIISRIVKNIEKIDIRNLKHGIYVLRLQRNQTIKFIKLGQGTNNLIFRL